MHTQRTQTLAKRRLILLAVIIIGALVQNCTLPVGDLRICCLLPLTVIIAMFEKEFAGVLYGLLAGCLWDVSTATADGMKALYLAIAGCVCGLLVRYLMRNNLLSALVLCSAVTIVFYAAHWLIYVTPYADGMFSALLRFYLPQALLTVLSAPFLYFLIRALEKKYRVSEESK